MLNMPDILVFILPHFLHVLIPLSSKKSILTTFLICALVVAYYKGTTKLYRRR